MIQGQQRDITILIDPLANRCRSAKRRERKEKEDNQRGRLCLRPEGAGAL